MRKVGLLAVFVFLAATAQAQYDGVTAELKLEQDQYLPGEDLQLKIRIFNRSGQQINLGADNDWLTLTIVGENNYVCPHVGEMPVKGKFSLQSGQMGAWALNPTPYFDFHSEGRYHVMATVRIPQWNQEIPCKPVEFTVANGVGIPGLSNLQFGVPLAPGASNAPPDVRAYSLLKISYIKELKLYFRLTDRTGRILRVFPIARLTSFSVPEGQIDKYNNFHVLVQSGARSFTYCVLNPDGQMLERQTHVYTETRPELKMDGEGNVRVTGGVRRVAADDLPPATPEMAR